MTQEQKDRIDREARNKFQYGGLIRTQSKREGYIAGATAEVERAQELVNALEWIKTYGPVDDLTKKFIDNALLKWEGNIITDPCPHCGKELHRDRNLCCRECGKEVEKKAADGRDMIARLCLSLAYEVSKDAESAKEYLEKEGVDMVKLEDNIRFIKWKAELIRLVKEATGEATVKVNDEEARKWFDDGLTPYQTFRETFNME